MLLPEMKFAMYEQAQRSYIKYIISQE